METPQLSAAIAATKQRPRRDAWVTAAAVVMLLEGGLGILYVPNLMGGDLRQLQSVILLIGGVSALCFAAGVGLLRLDGWARFAAGGLAAVSLLFMYAPALVVAMEHGVWLGFDWLGIVGFLLVLFAVVRHWPAVQER
jgi:hypothetical protein